jgi:hypothetical protein
MRRWLVAALILMLGFAPGVWAQISTGSIYGTVVDQSGAALPGVSVVLTGPNIGARTTTTDSTGAFRYVSLDPGLYKVVTSLSGFGTVDRQLKVDNGVNVNVSFSMKVSNVQETVTVTEETPTVDVKKTGTGTTLEQQELQDLPTSRDPWAILRQVPGVQVDRLNQAGSQSGQQSGYMGKGVTQQSAMWVLDGVVITDAAAQGASTSYYDFDAFDQVAVTTGGADVRVATGGVGINLVTKRGTNDFHGTARGYFTNHDLQSSNLPAALIGDPRLHGSDNGDHVSQIGDYGLDVGGPIVKDKLWFFGSYGNQDIRIVKFNQVPDKTLLKNYEGKINWQATGNDMVSILYFDGVKNKYGRPNPLPGTNEETASHTRDQKGEYASPIPGILKGEWNHVFGPSFVANVKYAHIDTGFGLVPEGGGLPEEVVNTVTGLSSGSGFTLISHRLQNEANADLDYFAGRHELKFGFGYRHATTNTTDTPFGNGLRSFITTTGNIAAIFRQSDAGYGGTYSDAYVSDTFTSGRLTINAGLRFDHQTAVNSATTAEANPSFPNLLPALSFNGSPNESINWNNFSPRLGISYALDESKKTVLHGSFAIFTDQLNEPDITDVNPVGNPGQLYYGTTGINPDGTISASQVNLNQPNLRPPVDVTPSTVNTIDPNLQPRRDTEFIVGLDREVAPNFAIAANYTYRRTVNQYYAPWIGVNGTDWVSCDSSSGNGYTAPCLTMGPTNSAAINANGFGYNLTNRPDYNRVYQGLEFTALKRLSNKWMARLAVSYNDWTENFGSKAGIQDPNPTLFDSYYAFSTGTADGVTNAQVSGGQLAAYSNGSGTTYWIGAKWQASASAMYQLPAGFEVAGNLFARQGYPRPLSETANNNLGENIIVTPVGGVRLVNVWNLDLRLAKDVRLGGNARMIVSADLFNAFNNNVSIRLNDFPDSAVFNQIDEIETPRLIRFGVRLTF